MKSLPRPAFVFLSLILHAALVLALGNTLTRPIHVPQPIEIDLEQPAGARTSGQGTVSPAPALPQAEPQPAAAPARAPAIPERLKRSVPLRRTPAPRPPVGVEKTAESLPTAAAARSQAAGRRTQPDAAAAHGPAAQDAEPGRSRAQPGGADAGGRSTPDASVLQAWLAAVRARIEDAKRYPFAAEERRIQGVVTVTFRLSAEGRLLGAPKLAESSGFSILDSAALRAVQQASPFPRFPGPAEDMPEGALSVEVKFRMR